MTFEEVNIARRKKGKKPITRSEYERRKTSYDSDNGSLLEHYLSIPDSPFSTFDESPLCSSSSYDSGSSYSSSDSGGSSSGGSD